jgi:hypothetical protein
MSSLEVLHQVAGLLGAGFGDAAWGRRVVLVSEKRDKKK